MARKQQAYLLLSILFSFVSITGTRAEVADSTILAINTQEEPRSATNSATVVGKIEDDFTVTPMGQACYEIPVPAIPGTGGMVPKLSITYNSSTKNGLLGYGFDLTGLSIISRVPRNLANDGVVGLVTFTTDDRFALDGARLIHTQVIDANTRRYSTECKNFARITANGPEANPNSFTVETKDGFTYEYNSNTKIINPNTSDPGLFWMLTKVTDTKGNYFTVSYTGNNSNNEIYPSRIDYTGNESASLSPYASLRFTYEANPDSAYTYVYGRVVRRMKCLNSIGCYYGNTKVRELTASYSVVNHRKQLTQITETASDGTQKPPTTFLWHNVGSMAVTGNLFNINSLYNVNLTVGDYNGDGKSDFLATPANSNAAYSGWQLFLSNGNSFTNIANGSFGSNDEVKQVVSGDFNGDGLDDFAAVFYTGYFYTTKVYLSGGSGFQDAYHVCSHTTKYSVHTVETNGDGAVDLCMTFENSGSFLIYKATVYSNGSISILQSYSGQCSEEWDEANFIDFNGDGLTDILNLHSSGNLLMMADGLGGYNEINLHNYNTDYDISCGDFNGDGKTDLLVGSWDGTQWSNWWLAMSDGVGMLRNERIPSFFQTADRQMFVVDGNGDGYDDFYAIEKASDNSGSMIQPRLYLNDGRGSFIAQPAGANTYPLDKWNYYFGDFNGDGKAEFICTANWQNTSWRGIWLFTQPLGNNMLLAKITDGLGNETSITYKHLSDGSIHDRGTTNQYPLTSFASNWPVVWQVQTPDGIGGVHAMTYHYENALVHKKGRGVLGFSKVSVTDGATNTTTATEYTPSANKFVMEPRHTETTIGSRLISETDVTYNYAFQNDTVFSHWPTSSVEKKYEYNSGLLVSEDSTSYSYDTYGNVTLVVTTNGSLKTTTINTYTNNSSDWILGRLTQSVVTKKKGTETIYRRATFAYDAVSGLLTTERTEPYNNSLGFSKSYVHDAFGNIIQSTTTPNNSAFASRTETTTYDAKGRFLTAQTNSLGHETTNSIDLVNGLLLSTTDANSITVSNTYDSFGRQTSSSSPVSTTQTTLALSSGMTDAPANARYCQRTETTGEPYVLEFFDCLGRTLRTVTENAQGQKIYTDVVYNAKGQVIKTSEPYFPGTTVYWNTNSYDAAGRIVSQTDAGGNTTAYSYNGFTTTTTDALGHSTLRTTDRYGNLVLSQDHEGGTIQYVYDIEGHCTQLTGPRTTVTMEYDLMGNRTRLDDPDLGTVTSVYNAYGEMVSQTDSKGTTAYTYDQGGRLLTETRPDVTVTNVYDTRFVGALSGTTASNSTSTQYYYDAYGRVVRQQETVGSKTFNVYTSFDQQNHVDVITYPNGFQVRHVYATNGLLTGIKNASTSAVIWQQNAANARGQVTSQTYGNGLATQCTFDALGRLTAINTPGIQNWSYAYDAVGDLTMRRDNSRSLTETFGYDALNRLVTVSRNGSITQRSSYDAAGNVTSRTEVGHDFVYEEGSNRLQTFYADSPMPQMWDDIQYTSFHKIRYIAQGSNSLTLTYGPGKSRCKAVTVRNGVTETKYYVGSLYEEATKSGVTVKSCYIFAAGKAVAIQETSTATGTRMFYLHHDHLGSIQAYTDASGNLLQELSYDAWGCRRDPATWERFDRFTEAVALNPWGFSGHEHIDIFEMVNMDGRMYDPVLGRFLSPDPFVQAPDFTQGLNRYTYCLNNPLSLYDPTGYSWLSSNWKSLLASAVGIAVSALTAGSAAGLSVAIIAGAAGGAAGALTGALLNGANIGQIAKATFTGAFWGGISGALNFLSADEVLFAKLFKHTFTQGWLEGIQGGNAVHGMMMGAVSGAGGHYIDKYQSTLGKAGEIAASAVLGGTVDELGGGKFANGAITSAFSTMFNDMMHPQSGDDDITPQIDLENNQTFQLYNYEKPLEPVYPEFYFLLGGGKLLGDAIIDGLSTLTIKLSSSCTKYLAKKTAIRYTEHGLKQAISRGFTDADIKMVVKHGIRQTNNNARFGPQYKYTLNHNSVVVDKKTNKVITVFSDRRNIPGKPDGYIYK